MTRKRSATVWPCSVCSSHTDRSRSSSVSTPTPCARSGNWRSSATSPTRQRGARCEHRYRDGGAWHNFRPDASLECERGGRRVRAWLEYDLGTMDASHLRRKLEACAYYVQSRKWVEEGITALPFLLFVVPDK